MHCAIWYHLHYLKNVKNTQGGVLLSVLKATLLHACFSRFLNCTDGTKSRNASHMFKIKKPISITLLTSFWCLYC